MITGYISYKEVIARAISDRALEDDINIPYHTMIDWLVDGLKAIGAHAQFEEKPATIKFKNYKGDLPGDFYRLVRIINAAELCINPALNTIDGKRETLVKERSISSKDINIKKDCIISNVKDGSINIDYLAFPADEDGIPLIPDNRSYLDALIWKITMHLTLRGFKFKQPALNDIQYVEQKWHEYCMEARGDANKPDAIGYERLKNIMFRLIPNATLYDTNFVNLGKAQRLDLEGN